MISRLGVNVDGLESHETTSNHEDPVPDPDPGREKKKKRRLFLFESPTLDVYP